MKLHVFCGIMSKIQDFYRPDFFQPNDKSYGFSKILIIWGKSVFIT